VDDTTQAISARDTSVAERRGEGSRQGALSLAAPTTAIDVAGARCNGQRTLQESVRDAGRSESAASRDIPRDGAHESLGDSVGLWRPKSRTNDLSPLASERLIKLIGEFLIPIANQKPQRFRALGQTPRQLTRLLNDPRCTRVRRATGRMHTAAAQLDEEEHVEALQPDRLDREEIDGQQTLAVSANELAPRRLPAFTGRSETGGPEPRAALSLLRP
jgi:hypothetical protein